MSSNSIASLTDLAPLSELPNLDTLSLRFNPLNDFSSEPSFSFNALRKLDLTGTGLLGLHSLHYISQAFPSLKALQTGDTPLSKVGSATLNTIARLPNLTELNHSTISADERQNAELFYLGIVAKELEVAQDKAEEIRILQNHPMWDALCRVHGTPTIHKVPITTIDPNTLEARVTIFTFSLYPPAPHNTRKEPESKEELLKSKITNTNLDLQHHVLENTEAIFDSQGLTNDTSSAARDSTTLTKSASIPRTTSCYAIQGIVGRLFALPPPFTTTIRLFYETDEWDPVAGTEGEDDGWSVSEDDDDDDHYGDGGLDDHEPAERRKERRAREKEKEKGKMVLRTEELVPSTRPVGDWITEREARVKVVLV